MGVVVAATHVDLDQRVALKFLLPEAAAHPDLVMRFAREARATAKIRSEHGVKVLDVGTLPTGLPYMVMEYLEGEDFKQLVKRMGLLPVDVATGYLLQACDALAEAHTLGIVHRDLKPSNLFLARHANGEPLVKVIDFGIAKAAPSGKDAVALTQAATMMGSPSYTSPEQLGSAMLADARSDIWSLGVVLYQLLTGVKPFRGQNMGEFVMAIVRRPHKPIREVKPDIPAGMEALIDRCLAKDPSMRFQNLGELALALAPFGPPRSDIAAEGIARLFGSTARPASVPPVSGIPVLVGPGSVAPGSVVAGSASPGSVMPGSVMPGSVTPGSVTPGSVMPGSVMPASVVGGGPRPTSSPPTSLPAAFAQTAPGTMQLAPSVHLDIPAAHAQTAPTTALAPPTTALAPATTALAPATTALAPATTALAPATTGSAPATPGGADVSGKVGVTVGVLALLAMVAAGVAVMRTRAAAHPTDTAPAVSPDPSSSSMPAVPPAASDQAAPTPAPPPPAQVGGRRVPVVSQPTRLRHPTP